MGNANTYNFMESFEDFGQKSGSWNCLNEYKRICEDKRLKLFFDLCFRTLIV